MPQAPAPKTPDDWKSLLRLRGWAALAPTRWLWLGLVVVLGLRIAGWMAQKFWLPEVPPIREILKGIAWDVALTCGVFALGRSVQVLRGARGWRLVSRVLGVGLVASAVVAIFVRWLDLAHCFMAHAHWTTDAFLYLDSGFAGSLQDPRLLGALAAMAVTATVFAVALVRDGRAAAQRSAGHGKLAAVALAVALLPAAWAVRDGVAFPPAVNQMRLTPEINFALKMYEALRTPPVVSQAPRLSPATWQKFAKLGLVPRRQGPDSDWPLLKPDTEFPPLPYPKRATATTDRPNVVLTFMESTNRLFVHGLSGRYQGLMPEVSALVPQMTSVQGFYNTSSPTIAALVTALCSIHPPAHPYDLRPGESVDGKAAYTCLGDLLRHQGYRTVYLQGASRTVTSKEYFLRTHGFDEVFGLEDFQDRYAKDVRGPWGLHDDQLEVEAERLIERLEAQRVSDGRPYLLVMLTLDPHEPGMAGPECKLPVDAQGRSMIADLPADDGARKQLASYHCSDKAIGALGRFVLQHGRRDRTLWVLTADHAMFADLVPESLYLGTPAHLFDHVPFLIHDPMHELPARVDTLSGTRDVAPTVLHLAGVEIGANSLTGLSIFGRRLQYPFLVGRIGERMAVVVSNDGPVELPVGTVRERCQRGDRLASANGVDFTACDLGTWIDWQDGLWASRRLFPAALYRGADGVDTGSLDARMERNRSERALMESLKQKGMLPRGE
jgi:hypothetical protein